MITKDKLNKEFKEASKQYREEQKVINKLLRQQDQYMKKPIYLNKILKFKEDWIKNQLSKLKKPILSNQDRRNYLEKINKQYNIHHKKLVNIYQNLNSSWENKINLAFQEIDNLNKELDLNKRKNYIDKINKYKELFSEE